jgi:hypothetical protein
MIFRQYCHAQILLQMLANFGELQPPGLGIISTHIERAISKSYRITLDDQFTFINTNPYHAEYAIRSDQPVCQIGSIISYVFIA